MVTKSETTKVLLSALDTISDGIETLEMNRDSLDGIIGPLQVDIAARLNAQSGALGKLVEPLKDRVKVQALASRDSGLEGPTGATVKGNRYQALVRKVTKTVMDNEKIKGFLGKKLSQFLKQRDELCIQFQVKS